MSGDSLTAGGAVPLAYASERPSRRSLWKRVVAEHTKFGGGYFVQLEGPFEGVRVPESLKGPHIGGLRRRGIVMSYGLSPWRIESHELGMAPDGCRDDRKAGEGFMQLLGSGKASRPLGLGADDGWGKS